MAEIDTRAQGVLRRLDETKARLSRAEGAAQASEQEWEAARQRAVDLGVDPDRIDEEIQAIEAQIASEVSRISAQIDHVSTTLQSVNH